MFWRLSAIALEQANLKSICFWCRQNNESGRDKLSQRAHQKAVKELWSLIFNPHLLNVKLRF
ncbi:MAG: hypothetical protein ACYTXA_15575 [Nostoc sp.]